MKPDYEYRIAELRSDGHEDMIVFGRAVVYETPALLRSADGRTFREIISKGALDSADLSDVPLRYNHNIKGDYPILARTRNKSLELRCDEQGLTVRARLLDEKIFRAIKDGLLDKMSFGFLPPRKENVQWRFDTPDGIPERRINKIDRLIDVSVVDTPAYQDASIYARSFDLLESELRALESEKNRLFELEKLRTQILLKG